MNARERKKRIRKEERNEHGNIMESKKSVDFFVD
jgi:hypothetical protein